MWCIIKNENSEHTSVFVGKGQAVKVIMSMLDDAASKVFRGHFLCSFFFN